jgi:putative membrane protein
MCPSSLRTALPRRVGPSISVVDIVANLAVAAIALLHVYILVLEMFLWTKPAGRRAFGTDAEFARASASLAANQGLYNGFLAAGLMWGLVAADPVGFQATVFFLSCVIVAGVYGAVTVNRRILFVQAVPAAIALALVLAAH